MLGRGPRPAPAGATATGSPDGLGARLRVRREHRHAGALADDLQLVRPRRAAAGRQATNSGVLPLAAQPRGQLARQRRLTGALQAGQHDHGRRGLGERQLPGLAAEDADEFLVDDLDDLLRRVERTGHLGAPGALLDPVHERADHGQRDVGLEQRQPDLAGGGLDVGVGQPALAAQPRRAPVSRSDSDSNTPASLVVLSRTRQRCPGRAQRVTTNWAQR